LDWFNPWNSGNKAMFLGIFLAYEATQFNDMDASIALQEWFHWHDEHQNPKTGFWGRGESADFIDGMGGAYHQYLVYRFMKRPIQYANRIVDRVLLLQQPDGTFSPYGGGMTCYEADAVDILVQMHQEYDYRRDDIEQALRSSLSGLLQSQNPDGGFCWGGYHPWGIKEFTRVILDISRHHSVYLWYRSGRAGLVTWLRRRPMLKTGWASQPRAWSTSSVFDTWFRCVAIAEIGKILGESPYACYPWKFLSIPGLGWFPE
jgi:hypothetical protein